MSTVLLAGLAAAGGLLCPAHMWWARRRGRARGCTPVREEESTSRLVVLRERQRQLEEQIARRESDARSGGGGRGVVRGA